MKRMMAIFALLLALATVAHGADWDKLRAQSLTLKDRGGSAVTTITKTWADSREPAVAAGTTAQFWRGDKTWQTLNQAAVAGLRTADSPTFTGLALGADGSGQRQLTIFSGAAGKSLRLISTSTGWGHLQTDDGLSITSGNSYINLISGNNQSQYFTCGNLWIFVDKDTNANRIFIDSATGNINNIGGAYQTNGTTRLDASGNATLASATVGGAKDWGKLTSAPAGPAEGDRYYNTTAHKLYCYDGTAWQACW